MRTGDAGVALIKRFEGLELEAYQDSVGIWTIGYGHTSAAGTPEVKPGMRVTEEEAEAILRQDLQKFERDVDGAVKVDLNQNEFDALVSFTFNVGIGNLKSSTLLRKLNRDDRIGASEEFPRWNKAGGRVLTGLVRRRAAEKALFLEPIGGIESLSRVDNPGEDTRARPDEASGRRKNLTESRTLQGSATAGAAGGAGTVLNMDGDDAENAAADVAERVAEDASAAEAGAVVEETVREEAPPPTPEADPAPVEDTPVAEAAAEDCAPAPEAADAEDLEAALDGGEGADVEPAPLDDCIPAEDLADAAPVEPVAPAEEDDDVELAEAEIDAEEEASPEYFTEVRKPLAEDGILNRDAAEEQLQVALLIIIGLAVAYVFYARIDDWLNDRR